MIPGMIGTLTLIQTMMLTAMSVAREREQGTFDQLLVTPFRPYEIMAGKALPSMLVGTIQATGVLLVAQLWFRIPFAGSYLTLYAGLLLFLLAAVGIGLLLSSVAATMQQAMLYSMLLIMPFSLLSGLTTPLSSMPTALQYLTAINPLRYAIDITRRVYLEGAGLDLLLSDLWPLALLAALTPVGGLVDVPPPHAMTTMRRCQHRASRSCPPCVAWLLTLCAGCTVGPQFVRPTPQAPAHWSAQAIVVAEAHRSRCSVVTEQSAQQPRGGPRFNDPLLDSLIERAWIRIWICSVAVLRIEESRAQRDVTAAGYWPTLSAEAAYSRQRLSDTTPTGALFNSVGNLGCPAAPPSVFPIPTTSISSAPTRRGRSICSGAYAAPWRLPTPVFRCRSRISARCWCRCSPMWRRTTSSCAARRRACSSPGRTWRPSMSCWS